MSKRVAHLEATVGGRAVAVEGLGIACLPVIIARRAVRERRLRRVLPAYVAPSAHLFLVHAKGLVPGRVRAFRDHVRTALAAA